MVPGHCCRLLLLLRRSGCFCDGADAARSSRPPLEVPPRPSSRCCWRHLEEGRQHLEEGRDEDDQLSARLYCECATRRSCDGVAAATELRRPAPSRSFCASRPRDATRRMRRPAFIFPRVDSNFNGLGPHSPRPPPWPRNSNCCCYYWT